MRLQGLSSCSNYKILSWDIILLPWSTKFNLNHGMTEALRLCDGTSTAQGYLELKKVFNNCQQRLPYKVMWAQCLCAFVHCYSIRSLNSYLYFACKLFILIIVCCTKIFCEVLLKNIANVIIKHYSCYVEAVQF